MTFEIFSRRGLRGRRWYFRAVGRNGEPILQSEGYANHSDCRSTVWLIRRDAGESKVDDTEHEALVLSYNFKGESQ